MRPDGEKKAVTYLVPVNSDPVNATWIQNENGSIREKNIEQDDLKNIVELTKGIAENSAYPMAVRVVNLRKYVELTKYSGFWCEPDLC